MFRGASELSGGEWHTIGLARTHWRDSTCDADGVLIVDEPASVLDPGAESAAFDRIRRLAAPSRAVVLVTHRRSGVRHAGRIHVLRHGRIVEHGGHDALMAARGRYAAMVEAQAARYAPRGHRPPRRFPHRHGSRVTRSRFTEGSSQSRHRRMAPTDRASIRGAKSTGRCLERATPTRPSP
ncbi:hypothetical protein [Streptomyces eurythermus]|uniref:hypothetical protein n=1 Tax=Streptomyces eurythermus TaxID=42237 RepID=UPI0036D36297